MTHSGEQVAGEIDDHSMLTDQALDRLRQPRRSLENVAVQPLRSLRDRHVLAKLHGELHERSIDPLSPLTYPARRGRGQRLLEGGHRLTQLGAYPTQRVQSRIRSKDDRFHRSLQVAVLDAPGSMLPPSTLHVQPSRVDVRLAGHPLRPTPA